MKGVRLFLTIFYASALRSAVDEKGGVQCEATREPCRQREFTTKGGVVVGVNWRRRRQAVTAVSIRGFQSSCPRLATPSRVRCIEACVSSAYSNFSDGRISRVRGKKHKWSIPSLPCPLSRTAQLTLLCRVTLSQVFLPEWAAIRLATRTKTRKTRR